MKRVLCILCALALIFSLAGCGSAVDQKTDPSPTVTADSTAEQNPDGQSLAGRVTAIEGARVTLLLGELTQREMQMDSEQGQTPPDLPGGGMPAEQQAEPGQAPNAAGGQPQGGMDMPPDQSGGNGNMMGQTPPDQPDAPGTEPSMGGSAFSPVVFTPGQETAAFDLSDAVILVETGAETDEGSLDAITVDSILTLELGADDAVKTVTVKDLGGGFGGNMGGFGGSGTITQGSAANTIDADGEYSGAYTSAGDDENALRVDGATVTLTGITVDKSGGKSSNTEDGDFYGMNAGLLATNGAVVTIRNAVVNTSAQNGNGVFSYGNGTVVNISDSVISTTADNSGGIQTTGGGTTNAADLTVTTQGNSAAAIRSDRGGGTVVVDGGVYTSNGYNSPAVYSTADITVRNATLTATNSEALVIEGKNSISLENCVVSGSMSDDKGTSSDENVHNVMIYQSMSGDADVGTARFSMTGGSLISYNGDLFHFTNTGAAVDLSGVELINHKADSYLMSITGNDASHGWGRAGANGAQVVFTARGQKLEGDILVDTISTLDLTLSDGSTLVGTIRITDNAQNGTPVADNAVVTLEAGCVWKLTGNCVISSVTNNGRIDFNGYTITLADGTVLK